MKRRTATQRPGTFTTNQIQDAYITNHIRQEAEIAAQTPEEIITTLYHGWDDTGAFTRAKREQYARGAALLDRAMLIESEIVQSDSPAARQARAGLTRAGSTVVELYAGDDCVRYVTLAPKTREFAQVGEVRAAYPVPA